VNVICAKGGVEAVPHGGAPGAPRVARCGACWRSTRASPTSSRARITRLPISLAGGFAVPGLPLAITLPGMTTVLGKCISADSHVTEPAGTYVDRIDPKFRDPRAAPCTTTRASATSCSSTTARPWCRSGWFAAAGRPAEEVAARHRQALRGSLARRLGSGRRDSPDQDIDGVSGRGDLPVGRDAASATTPTSTTQHACFDAYNQWIAEFWRDPSPNRLIGMGQNRDCAHTRRGDRRPRGHEGARSARA